MHGTTSAASGAEPKQSSVRLIPVCTSSKDPHDALSRVRPRSSVGEVLGRSSTNGAAADLATRPASGALVEAASTAGSRPCWAQRLSASPCSQASSLTSVQPPSSKITPSATYPATGGAASTVASFEMASTQSPSAVQTTAVTTAVYEATWDASAVN